MNRPKTNMDSRTVRASSSRTPRGSIDGPPIAVGGESILSRPKTAQTKSSYFTKKPKSVVTEEILELPACRPTTGVRKTNLLSVSMGSPETRPNTAPYPAKSWTQLVRNSSFHRDEQSGRKHAGLEEAHNAWVECPENTREDEYRIVLIGKAGSGKSSTGNCILGRNIFGKNSSSCRYGTSERFGKKICVVDTYGVFDKGSDISIVPRELVKLVGMTSPGFHVLLFVVSIGNINNKEHNVFKEFVRHFGNDVKRRTIVLFTRRDILESDGSTIYGYVNDLPKGIQDVMFQNRRKYLAFNNNATGRERDVQVNRLLAMIDNIAQQHNGRHLSSEIFGAAELVMRRRMDEIKRSLKEKLKIEQDQLETKLKASKVSHSVRSSLTFDDIRSPRNSPVKTKKSLRRKKNKCWVENNEFDNCSSKLPNLNVHNNKEHKKRSRRERHGVEHLKSPRGSSTNADILYEQDDDDFGDCDIEAIKKRIEEDIDVPTLHLPSDHMFDSIMVGSDDYELINGNFQSDSQMIDLRKRYDEEMSKHRLREKVRDECEQEQPELFQMMWKLTRYFDHSLQLTKP